MSEPGPSTSQTEASSDVDVEAATLLSQGRKFLLKGDAPSAVQCLQEACELLGTKYGELANECGESYYYYGWALLEVASMETGVLGNALDGVPESEDDTGAQGEGDNIEDPNKVDEKEKEKIFHDVQNALETKEEKVKGQDDEDKSQESASEMESGRESEKEEATAESEGEKIKVDDETAPSDKEKKDAEEKADEVQEEKPMDVEEEAGQKDDTEEGKAKEEAKTVEKDDAEAKKEEKGDTEAKKVEKGDTEAKQKEKDGTEAQKEEEDGVEAKKEEKNDTESKAEEKDGKEVKTAGKDEEAGPSDADGDDDDGDDEEGAEAAAPGEDVKDEDVSNFQLSWEMLELARIIFSKQEGDEFKLKVSQVYLKLGELGLETGNFAQSVEDFTQCLTIQKQQLSDDSRLLAETHYNLALAYSFDQKFDKAIENFEQSVVIIQNRITMLRKKAESDNPPSAEDLAQNEKEIKELEALIPEIKLKIEDAKAEKTSAETAVRQALKSASSEFGLGSSTSTASTSGFPQSSCSGAVAKPIAIRKAADSKPDDISHLVHRKRKSEENVEEGAAGKKSRQEEGAGDAAVNGSNGVEQTAMNGDAKHSPDKPEIKVKQVEQVANGDSAQAAPMET